MHARKFKNMSTLFIVSLTLSGCLKPRSADVAGKETSGKDVSGYTDLGTPADNSYEFSNRPQLPSGPRNEALRKHARELNHLLKENTPTDRIRFEPRSGSGNSCYVVAFLDGALIGMLMPLGNLSGNIESEANLWSLLRALGYEIIGQPAAYVTVAEWGQRKFEDVGKAGCDGTYRKEGLKKISRRFSDAGYKPARFVIKLWDTKPEKFTSLLSNNSVNESNVLIQSLKKDAPPPGGGAYAFSSAHKNKTLTWAKELSTGLIVDRIQGQWDRWSGGNIGAQQVDGEGHFAWFDAGGATFGPEDTRGVFGNIAYRFDAAVVDKIRTMDDFLSGRGGFLGFTNSEDFRIAMNLFTREGWEGFKANLHTVRQVIDERSSMPNALLP